ncbi:hypothetical protein RBB50_010145 [Rhinocladiella similis]
MRLFIRHASYILAIVGLVLQTAHGTPLPRTSTILARDSTQSHGSSCNYWTEETSVGNWVYKVQCDKIGRGLKIRGVVRINTYPIRFTYTAWTDNNNLGAVVSTSFSQVDHISLDNVELGVYFGTSGNPDMGSCDSNLVEVEHAIKNGWYNSMTCTDISPYVKVRAVLDIPGAFDQYSAWIETPQTVQTLEREAWFGRPSAYAEWEVREE